VKLPEQRSWPIGTIVVATAIVAVLAWLGGSHGWLAGALGVTAFAFMRVPFHIYWRPDAALLAQLPLPGEVLLAAAMRRCVRSAAATALACALGAAALPTPLVAHHVVLALVLGLVAALFMPAVAVWSAMIVVAERTLRGQASAVLGALPGFASSVVIVAVILAAPWLDGGDATGLAILGALAGASVLASAIARLTAPSKMGAILRDVSALDRQRLARLEINPPTRLERGVAYLLGDAALPYGKDARLMRRRYPMAFALGTLAFVVLAIVGLARPDDPWPWLVAVLAGGALYGAALGNRLRHPPIELPRLSATLPIDARARALAKLAWIVTWATLYLAIPATFALLRT
jgi:hypothetical protein